jgi:hypothetical protein
MYPITAALIGYFLAGNAYILALIDNHIALIGYIMVNILQISKVNGLGNSYQKKFTFKRLFFV